MDMMRRNEQHATARIKKEDDSNHVPLLRCARILVIHHEMCDYNQLMDIYPEAKKYFEM